MTHVHEGLKPDRAIEDKGGTDYSESPFGWDRKITTIEDNRAS